MKQDGISIRPACEEDASTLLEIYAPYVRETAVTFEYDVPSEEEFKERILSISKRYPYLVAEDIDGKILGYAYAHCLYDRRAYDWSVEASIYISQEHRKEGIGRTLYESLFEKLRSDGIRNVYACLGYSSRQNGYLSHDSLLFHEKMGFSKVGHFSKCGYKFGLWWDVVWMEKMIGDHTERLPL